MGSLEDSWVSILLRLWRPRLRCLRRLYARLPLAWKAHWWLLVHGKVKW